MYSSYQTLGAVITIGYIVLAPLLIGLMIALARASARRTVIAVAIAVAALVFVGVAVADALTGMRGQFAYYRSATTAPTRQGALVLALASLLLSAGLSLSFAAVILGLRETAWARHWGWFVAFLLTQLAAGIGTTLFYVNYEQFSIAEPQTRRCMRATPASAFPITSSRACC
jgi:hypothetical protein